MTKFRFPETAIAKAKGLQFQYVAELRKKALVEGVDWVVVDGAVQYSKDGLQTLEALLILEKEARPKAEEQVAQVEKVMKGKITGTVKAVFAKNSKALEVNLPGGRTCVVAVAVNTNFMLGMPIEMNVGPRGEIYFAGRLPRGRGRW